ncbi:MAG: tetratricopeptide repeat protein [Pseudomonadota bacterium]
MLAALAIALSGSVGMAATPDERVTAYQDFRGAFDKGDYKLALPAAARVLEMTRSQFGTETPEVANALTNLATTYYRMHQYGEALDHYRNAITLLELQNQPTDTRLVRPLQGLGSTLLAMQREDEALVPLKRAIDIVRNHDGLHAESQLPVLRTLIVAYEATDRLADAGREHDYAFAVAEQAYGRNDPRMLGPLDDLAHWHEKSSHYTAARALYERAVQVADAGKPNGIQAVPGLRGIARCLRLAYVFGETEASVASLAQAFPQLATGNSMEAISLPSSDGERDLRSALQRLGNAPAQAALRGAVLVDLGDWYLTANKASLALSSWREGWKELVAAGDTSLLDQPALLYYHAPGIAVSRHQKDPNAYSEQRVDIRLAFEANGKVRDASVANPAPEREAAEKSVMSAARQATWRPAFRNGSPSAVDDYVFHEMIYVKLPAPN